MVTALEAKRAGRVWRKEHVGGERRRVLETLLRERQRAFQTPPAHADGGPDPVDLASEQEEEAVWLAVLDRSRDVQAAVEEALRRLATGEYGLCMDCGQHIAAARLRALPFAVRCLACQERFEREARRGHRQSMARGDRQDALPW
jgi:DnaK suppressor protein